MTNMLFWFIMKPTDNKDPVKTIVTRFFKNINSLDAALINSPLAWLPFSRLQ